MNKHYLVVKLSLKHLYILLTNLFIILEDLFHVGITCLIAGNFESPAILKIMELTSFFFNSNLVERLNNLSEGRPLGCIYLSAFLDHVSQALVDQNDRAILQLLTRDHPLTYVCRVQP